MRIVVPLLKLGLAGGAVYYVADQGLFSINQKETIDASKRISNSVPEIPGLDNYTNKLSVGISKNDLINYWNKGVKVSIAALASLPADTKELTSRGYHYVKEELGKQMK